MEAEENKKEELLEVAEKIENIEEPKEKNNEQNNFTVQELKKIESKQDEKVEKVEIKEECKKNINDEKIAKHKEKDNKSSLKIFIIVTFIIILLILVSTMFAILNINNSNIIKGIHIEDVNISNLSKEEVVKNVNARVSAIENVELIYGEYSVAVNLEEIGVEIDAKTALKDAINLGKTSNIILDNYSILKANIFGIHYPLSIKINEQKFKDTLKNVQAEMPGAVKEYYYEINKEQLIITKGIAGKAIEEEILKEEIIKNIKEQFNNSKSTNIIELKVRTSEPEEINIEKIYNEVKKEPQDANIIEDEKGEIVKVNKEENGIDFAITIEEAKELVKENKETYAIPLKVITPKVAIKDLGEKLFKQTLSKYSTIYDAGNANRSHNVALATKTLNGTILLPGETFSYNGKLGNTNAAKGYKQATAYVAGKVVPSYGGGICQVSSTLYNAVLYANLEIVQRYNHSYIVSYVPAGRDATVAYGGKDFKFKNNRSYPIKIVSSAKNGVVSISITGIKEEVEYDVELTSTVLSTTPRSVVYENNSEIEEGKEKIIQKGYDGKKSIAYKILKLNGKTISKTVLSKDTYKPMNKIIQVGTKKVQTVQTVAPILPENSEVIQ